MLVIYFLLEWCKSQRHTWSQKLSFKYHWVGFLFSSQLPGEPLQILKKSFKCIPKLWLSICNFLWHTPASSGCHPLHGPAFTHSNSVTGLDWVSDWVSLTQIRPVLRPVKLEQSISVVSSRPLPVLSCRGRCWCGDNRLYEPRRALHKALPVTLKSCHSLEAPV